MTLTQPQLNRAIGSVIASAAGDALGSQYEFGPALAQRTPVTFGVGYFGHAVGEWTDDTSMAMPILLALSRGESLNDEATLGRIFDAWYEWSRTSKDVGAQTRQVLGMVPSPATEAAARNAAQRVHDVSGRSGGNGSLMRTGPVALGYLADTPQDAAALTDAATRIAHLTHWEDDNADAVVLWCQAVRHAILTGAFDLSAQLVHVPEPRRSRWAALVAEALAPGVSPYDYTANNGWVVAAFQSALSAIAHTENPVDALELAIRGGGDTDTVAAIAGSLAGAIYGADALPDQWSAQLHGYPDLVADDLKRLVIETTR